MMRIAVIANWLAGIFSLGFALGMHLGLGASAPAVQSYHPAGVTRAVTPVVTALMTSTSTHVCHTPVPSGATYHVIPAGDSLYAWANRHAYGSGNVLSATIQCGPGIQQLSFLKYLNRGNLKAGLRYRTGVWVPFFVR